MHSSAELLAIVESMDRKGAISNYNFHNHARYTLIGCIDDISSCSKNENGHSHSFSTTTRYPESQKKTVVVEGPSR